MVLLILKGSRKCDFIEVASFSNVVFPGNYYGGLDHVNMLPQTRG